MLPAPHHESRKLNPSGLWLDHRLTYSCAYFPPGTTPDAAAGMLDEAQEAKLALIAGSCV